jgi:hypothetical protein
MEFSFIFRAVRDFLTSVSIDFWLGDAVRHCWQSGERVSGRRPPPQNTNEVPKLNDCLPMRTTLLLVFAS